MVWYGNPNTLASLDCGLPSREFECQYSKYVDDTNIKHISSDSASATKQNDADTARIWSSQNDMILNATKSKELRVDFSKSRGAFTQLYMGHSPIEVVSQSKVLGVTISDDLKWNQHVDYITGKASQCHIYWCYTAGLVSPQMKCDSCTQLKVERYWNMRVPHGILA